MSNKKGPDHSRRKERSRQAILAAARALVAEESYEKVTVEAIAARAGVGKQTIYRRWPSKSAVVFAAILALSEDTDGQSVALPNTGDLEADLKFVMRATAEEFADPSFDRLIRALNTEIASDAALAAEYREKLAQPLEEAKKARLRSAQEVGQLDADADLDLVLEVLYAPLFQRWLHRSGPLTAAYADSLVDATLRAFGP
ncbi:TetR/AcrR family transcriptional regulator [Streptomyces europaeiscabiei]|uniref:TetR/AcrR family transcriptional regulator n=1 Tax=Streptomyces TaxID=1883 RepID=UPI000A361160|nr:MULTISPECIES: TetR/AcrR family transcriptional regulator [Streptomyces]MDX3637412.1 TetR/AcrR family transcriptional regulator [Streptomyces europaeiscabiei]MDX3652973.1 TetR/AcrR family transcriptional regulator [Streptomyces europaeiscabiei]